MKHKEVTERDGERKQDANTHSKIREKGTAFFSFSVSFGFMWCNLSLIKKAGSHDDNKQALQRRRCHVYHEGDLHNKGCKEGGGKQEPQDSD